MARPAIQRGTFIFRETYTLGINDEAGVVRRYALNSLYDPVYEVGGGTPSGVAAFASLYSRYRVLSADVHITLVNQGTDSAIFGMVPSNTYDGTDLGTGFLQRLTERGTGAYHVLRSVPADSRHEVLELRKHYDIRAIEGVPDIRSNVQRYSGQIGSNPGSEVLLHVGLTVPGSGFVTSTVVYTIEIRYNTELFGFETVDASEE